MEGCLVSVVCLGRRIISTLPTQRQMFGTLTEPVTSTTTGLLTATASVLRDSY